MTDHTVRLLSVESTGRKIQLISKLLVTVTIYQVIIKDIDGYGYNVIRTFANYEEALKLFDCYMQGN